MSQRSAVEASWLLRRLKQTGVQYGTEYIDKQCDGLAGSTVDEALHKYQYMLTMRSVVMSSR